MLSEKRGSGSIRRPAFSFSLRFWPDGPDGDDASGPRYSLAAAVLRMHAERMNLGKRERRLAEHFTSAHPAIPVAEVVAQPEDVHDLDGLRVIGTSLSQQNP